ncbi:MAG: MBL fold metallo-hydrolase [Roseiflexaceae bacterium]
MRLTFLGTGTSMGIPMIACRCAVCQSNDPFNRRLRTSALLEVGDLTILIDAGPDLREQALRMGIARLDAVLLTHAHTDHIAGIDDLRPINFAMKASIPLYGTAATLDGVRERFAYAFRNGSEGSTRPALDLIEIADFVPFSIGALPILPLPVQHGTWQISSFRIGRLGYVTDASAIDAPTREQLRDLDVLVLNALRHTPHPTHFTVAEALTVIEDLRPQRALLVHMGHELDHTATNASLPAHVQLAYDGQVVEIAAEAS